MGFGAGKEGAMPWWIGWLAIICLWIVVGLAMLEKERGRKEIAFVATIVLVVTLVLQGVILCGDRNISEPTNPKPSAH